MKLYNKLSLLFLKFLPIIMLIGCIVKINLFAINEGTIAKHVNVWLSIFISLGLWCISYTMKFCKVYRILLCMSMYAYINYEVYLTFEIPYNNIWTKLYLAIYSLITIVYALINIKKCKLLKL